MVSGWLVGLAGPVGSLPLSSPPPPFPTMIYPFAPHWLLVARYVGSAASLSYLMNRSDMNIDLQKGHRLCYGAKKCPRWTSREAALFLSGPDLRGSWYSTLQYEGLHVIITHYPSKAF